MSSLSKPDCREVDFWNVAQDAVKDEMITINIIFKI